MHRHKSGERSTVGRYSPTRWDIVNIIYKTTKSSITEQSTSTISLLAFHLGLGGIWYPIYSAKIPHAVYESGVGPSLLVTVQ